MARTTPALLLSSCLAFSFPAKACDIALILAVDVSGSVNPDEYRIQMDGLATALQDGSIAEALVLLRASVMVMQWTGTSRQHISVPWRQITDFEDVDELAAQVAGIDRSWRNFSTAIGEAMQLALDSFAQVPDCARRTVDISGDGVSNEGVSPMALWPALRAAGVTVNGLAIESDFSGLSDYYRRDVITGPGAFVVTADDFEDYPRAIRLKLLRELLKQTATLEKVERR